MKNLTFLLENRPGTLAQLCDTLATAGVNIEGISGVPCEMRGLINLLVKNADLATTTLEKVKIEVKEVRDVLIWDLAEKDLVGKPGALADLLFDLSFQGINVNLIYFTENSQVVVGVDDFEKARDILG
jgi:hypothetical protein